MLQHPTIVDTARAMVHAGSTLSVQSIQLAAPPHGIDVVALVSAGVNAVLVGALVIATGQLVQATQDLRRTTERTADEAAALQRQIDADRRSDAERAQIARQHAVDDRIRALASAVSRELRRWQDSAPRATLGELDVNVFWVLGRLGQKVEPNAPEFDEPEYERTAWKALDWAKELVGERRTNLLERRLLQMLTAAPEASAEIQRAVHQAAVFYFDAKKRSQDQIDDCGRGVKPSGLNLHRAHLDLSRARGELAKILPEDLGGAVQLAEPSTPA